MKRVMQNALIVCGTVLLTLILMEAVVRLAGETNANGQFTFIGYVLQPYPLPVNELRADIENSLKQRTSPAWSMMRCSAGRIDRIC